MAILVTRFTLKLRGLPELGRTPVVLALVAAALCLYTLHHARSPTPPDPDRWLGVAVSQHPLPPSAVPAAGGLAPGMRLSAHEQVVARLDTEPVLDGRLTFSADLADEGELHAIVRGRHAQDRGATRGVSLYLSRIHGSPLGLYRIEGSRLSRLPCPWLGRAALPRSVVVDVGLSGDSITATVDGETVLECRDPQPAAGGVAFRSGEAPITVAGITLADGSGQALFMDAPEARQTSPARLTLLCLAVLAIFGAVWAVDGRLLGVLLAGKPARGARLAVWSYLPLLALPVFDALDLDGFLAGMRMGHTSILAFQLGLVVAGVALIRLVQLLLYSPWLRMGATVREPRAMLRTAAGVLLIALTAVAALTLGAAAANASGWLSGLVTALLVGAYPLVSLSAVSRLTGGMRASSWHAEILALIPLATAGVVALARPGDGAGWSPPLMLAAGSSMSVVIKFAFLHVNARWFRGYNVLSLAGCLVLVSLAEITVRQTYLDSGWDPVPQARFQSHPLLGWVRASREFDYILDVQEPTDYPLSRFPVAFDEARGDGPARIVCTGGSSTGGAYQNDDLDTFYPSRLERILDDAGHDAEVLNQGVGGWNSFHVRLYLREFIQRLRPDVLTVYVGMNDLNTLGGWTYTEYWRTYQRSGGAVPVVRHWLNRSRLYVAFKSLLLLRGGSGQVPAVPVEDARDNLGAICDLAAQQGTDVVLVSEAIRPPPAVYDRYLSMMHEVSQAHGAHYLDAAGHLESRGFEDLFLDQNHLTDRGHEVLADLLAEYLAGAGLLER